MLKIRLLIALAVTVALFGCQQPGTGQQRAATATDDRPARAYAPAEAEYEPSPWFMAKVKEVTLKMMDRMLSKCLDASGEAAMEACFHERMLTGFDRDGTLKAKCPAGQELGEDMTCILVGGMGHEIASKLGDDAVAGFDWSDPEKSAEEAMNRLVLQEVRNCLGSGSASDPYDCVIARVTTSLDLSGGDLDRCTGIKDDDLRFGNCVGEAYGYKYMLAGAERM